MTKDAADVDALYADLLSAGEVPALVAEVLRAHEPDEETLVSVLHRAVPVRALEYLARQPPWSERSLVLAAVVLNPKAPPRLSLALVPALLWRHLADVALCARLPGAVRFRAESVLKERLPELRLGEKITLGRLATTPVLLALVSEPDRRVIDACLENPRLRESDLVVVLRRPEVLPLLIEAVTASSRWRESYLVRLTVVLQERCPLGIALAQLSSLNRQDLVRVAETPSLAPLVRASAQRVAEER